MIKFMVKKGISNATILQPSDAIWADARQGDWVATEALFMYLGKDEISEGDAEHLDGILGHLQDTYGDLEILVPGKFPMADYLIESRHRPEVLHA